MTEYVRGLKAGIVSGLIFGITNAIIGALTYWFMLESTPGEMSGTVQLRGVHFEVFKTRW